MTIEEFHIDVRRSLNPGQGRYFTPLEIDSAINKSILDHFKDDYKRYEETQEITDTLGFFKKFIQIDVVSGSITFPDDFIHTSEIEAVLSDSSTRPFVEIKDSSWSRRKNSKGFGPTPLFPMCRQYENKMEVLPISGPVVVSKVNLWYLRRPAVAKYNFDEVMGYGFAYKDSGSVQVDWPEIDHSRILLKALGYLGIPTQNTMSIQAEQIKKASGA